MTRTPFRTRTLGAAALVAAVALTGAACGKSGDSTNAGSGGGSSSSASKGGDTKSFSYKVNTAADLKGSPVWAKAKKTGKITIGVKADQPGLGFQDVGTKKYSGFDIEIARMVAADLGFAENQINYKTIDSAQREAALSGGQVDLYVGTYTINDERKKQVSFAGPYFVAGQDLLVQKSNSDITGPTTVKGKKVCSVEGSTPLQNISQKKYGATTSSFDKYSKCVNTLLSGQVDAVTTDDAILLGYAAQYPDKLKVVGKPFTKEPYGVGLKKGDTALQTAVDNAITAHEQSGDWKKAFEATLGKSGMTAPQPPAITEK
ncbi:ABC transporter substrate-binding protein [Mangrovactinospora gilvigrisea]|uniref:ABC transporter substrate-binding protein n=1 Tax=Mangrovactinospora gilvigrisea TaxID=1428644 RepID=A0A1J7BCZ1_9ACTN|nr:glutamate ABC transporter substrate-binding protein [Mangrovactinospora gilvigrisea]OIV36461.1 ABC transporter substrate-binding protein [Mangrovactinospora gilvigrisea]